MKEIAIYVEGGGNTAQQKSDLRLGFNGLFSELKKKAEKNKYRWKLILCGGRQQAYQDFNNALTNEPQAINILLVDSEDPISLFDKNNDDAKARVKHLKQRDNWSFSEIKPERVHLMVQCMEAWIISDAEALATFYGQGFLENCLPKRNDLEEELKSDIEKKLMQATRSTQKGEYAKIKHASKLLKIVSPTKIEKRCPRFKEFVRWLDETIDHKNT